MSFRCPHCGEEYQLFQIPQESKTIRCVNCGQEFSPDKPDDAPKDAGKMTAPQTDEPGASDDAMKELAQQYFADIPDEPASESGAPVSKPAGKPEKAWSAEDDISEEDKQRQRQRLFEFAQKTAPKAEDTAPSAQEELPTLPNHKHVIREKPWQPRAHHALVLLAVCIPLIRIILGRLYASAEQFNWMQPQFVPSFLYFFAAVILPYHLLRRTSAPQLFPTLLLLVPLIFDFWYLVPGITETLPPDTLLSVGSVIRIAVLAFAVIMCFKTKKHPALSLKEVRTTHAPVE